VVVLFTPGRGLILVADNADGGAKTGSEELRASMRVIMRAVFEDERRCFWTGWPVSLNVLEIPRSQGS
jgi:hypothetical protein